MRNRTRGDALAKNLRQRCPLANIQVEVVDLCSIASTMDLVRRVETQHAGLHALVHAAAITEPPARQTITEDGFCTVMQTNALASFVLTTQLTPLMRNARHARVVNLASDTGLPIIVKEEAVPVASTDQPSVNLNERKHEHPWPPAVTKSGFPPSTAYPGDPRVPIPTPMFIPQLGRGASVGGVPKATCFYPLVQGDLRLADLYNTSSGGGNGGRNVGDGGGGGGGGGGRSGGGRRRHRRSNNGARTSAYDPGDAYVQSKIALRQVLTI